MARLLYFPELRGRIEIHIQTIATRESHGLTDKTHCILRIS